MKVFTLFHVLWILVLFWQSFIFVKDLSILKMLCHILKFPEELP